MLWVKMTRWVRIRLVCLQFSSKIFKNFLMKAVRCQLLPNFFFEKLRMIEIGPWGHWKWSSIFQSSHPSQKSMLSKALSLKKTLFVRSFTKNQIPWMFGVYFENPQEPWGTVVVCYKMWGHKISLSKWIWTQCTCWCESTSFLILSHCVT